LGRPAVIMYNELVLEQMLSTDLTFVNETANSIHTSLPERPEVFEEKFNLFPEGCKKLIINYRIVGYCISHPWNLCNIPPLDSFLLKLPQRPDCIYIHDIAILPTARGKSASDLYISELIKIAKLHNINNLALVSVYGTTSLWERYGFQIITDAALEKKTESYGNTAAYMVKQITKKT
jgi:ribosomal protein S18 acetylase RimI-like enzyme